MQLTTQNAALFLDFDGTLVDFAPSPDAVIVPPVLPPLLHSLKEQMAGAIALVTGRHFTLLAEVLNVDPYVSACEHGSDVIIPPSPEYAPLRRHFDDSHDAGGTAQLNSALTNNIRAAVMEFAEQHGLFTENKKTSITLHYRTAPEKETDVKAFIQSAIEGEPSVSALFGKCVVEIRFDRKNKGSIIRELMTLHPFRHRTPIFIGDDVTDEHAFEAVNALDGISIKVGEGNTFAKHRLATIDDVYTFLASIEPNEEIRP